MVINQVRVRRIPENATDCGSSSGLLRLEVFAYVSLLCWWTNALPVMVRRVFSAIVFVARTVGFLCLKIAEVDTTALSFDFGFGFGFEVGLAIAATPFLLFNSRG